jgi:two-component system, NarL family, sensor kinase
MNNQDLKLLFTSMIIWLLPICSRAQTGDISILKKHDTSAYNISKWTEDILGQIGALKKDIENAPGTKQKLDRIFSLCDKNESLNNDTLYTYALIAKKLALKIHDQKAEIRANYYLTISYANKGDLGRVIAMSDSNRQLLTRISGDKSLYENFGLRKANAIAKTARYKEALVLGYQLLKEAESSNDTLMQVKSENFIGWVNREIGQFQPALNWFYKAVQYASYPKYFAACRKAMANMAGVYIDRNQMDSAYYFINKALDADKADQNLTNMVDVLNVKGYLLVLDHQNKAAGPFFNAAYTIRRQLGDPSLIISEIITLCQYDMVSGQPEKGIDLAKEGIGIANKYHLKVDLVNMYSSLASNYKAGNDYANYSNTLEKIISIKDSIYRNDAVRALAEIEAKYEVQKKENTIIRQKLDIINRDKFLYAALAFSALLLFIIFILYANYRKKQERQKQQETIAVMQAEENARKRIASDLHDNIGAYAAAISAGVDELYNETAANPQVLENLKSNVFEIMTSLRDTIWAMSKESVTLTNLSDRIKIYVQKIQSSYKGVQIIVEENINVDHILSPLNALHLFRILQESVNNSLKHSKCSRLSIYFKCDQVCIISVEDDGNGFDPDKSQGIGNGMSNMQLRATEAGISIDFKQVHPHGTCLTLSLTNL